MTIRLKGVQYKVYSNNTYIGYIILKDGGHGYWEAHCEKLVGCLASNLGTFGTKTQAIDKLQEYSIKYC